jgi:glycosyltransferase involved in cell wall biosynthesis
MEQLRPGDIHTVDVSFVLPCLNEVGSLAQCIAMVREACDAIALRHQFSCEIIIADNGSTDGSQALAASLGARVEPVAERGYGAALRHGFQSSRGRYLVMGDADGSYDFRDAVAMIDKLVDGADLCMGSRWRGGIAPGAMPWKNRYIGNPLLTGVLNLLFRTGVGDAHCGLRALTRDCVDRLRLSGAGMEFASEMVIKAALTGARIAETPASLSPDLRDRPPHLRPWRDGWRHLRYLFMLSPMWLFAIPAALGATVALAILIGAALPLLLGTSPFFGDVWSVLAGALLGISHLAALLAVGGQLYSVRENYRRPPRWMRRLANRLTLETMLMTGAVLFACGVAILAAVAYSWIDRDFMRGVTVLPAVLGTSLMTLGAQTALGGFFLSIIAGNEARFLRSAVRAAVPTAPWLVEEIARTEAVAE